MARGKQTKSELATRVRQLAEERAQKFGHNVPKAYDAERLQKQSFDNLKKMEHTLKRDGGWRGGKRGNAPVPTTRQEGTKNLVKLDSGRLQNQHGVEFSEGDKKRLQSLVNSANRKRKKMLEQEAEIPRSISGAFTGRTAGDLHSMGTESDFILARKSKSLQRFKSREEFDRYIKNLERVNSPTYLEDRVRLYKRNHMQALEAAFGDDAKDVIMKIKTMKHDEYMQIIQGDENAEIGYIYDPSARSGKLNQIRAAFGMKLKEDEIEDL